MFYCISSKSPILILPTYFSIAFCQIILPPIFHLIRYCEILLFLAVNTEVLLMFKILPVLYKIYDSKSDLCKCCVVQNLLSNLVNFLTFTNFKDLRFENLKCSKSLFILICFVADPSEYIRYLYIIQLSSWIFQCMTAKFILHMK